MKRQLTIASGASSLRSISSRISSSVAARIALGLVGIGLRRAPHGEESLFAHAHLPRRPLHHGTRHLSPEAGADLVPRGEAAGLALGEIAELERAEADAAQRDHLVADRLGHAPHLAVAALAQDDLDLALAEPAHLGRRGRPVLELDPAAAAAGRPRAGGRRSCDPVGLRALRSGDG